MNRRRAETIEWAMLVVVGALCGVFVVRIINAVIAAVLP